MLVARAGIAAMAPPTFCRPRIYEASENALSWGGTLSAIAGNRACCVLVARVGMVDGLVLF